MSNEELAARLRTRLKETYQAVLQECLAGLQLAGDVKDVDQASFWAHKLIPSTTFQGHLELAHTCTAIDEAVEEGSTWQQIEELVTAAIAHAERAAST